LGSGNGIGKRFWGGKRDHFKPKKKKGRPRRRGKERLTEAPRGPSFVASNPLTVEKNPQNCWGRKGGGKTTCREGKREEFVNRLLFYPLRRNSFPPVIKRRKVNEGGKKKRRPHA